MSTNNTATTTAPEAAPAAAASQPYETNGKSTANGQAQASQPNNYGGNALPKSASTTSLPMFVPSSMSAVSLCLSLCLKVSV